MATTGQQSGKTGTGTRRAANPIPQGFHTITPYLTVDGGTKLIDFLKRAFGATVGDKMETPDGKIGHADLKIGDSHLMLSDAMMDMKATPSSLYLYVEDADALYRRALEAGAKSVKEPADQFYGDRSACVKDFAGNTYWLATHIEDVPKDELQRRSQEQMRKMQKH